MSFVELEALEKVFPDGTRAVRGIDLAIEEGEFVVLLGPSGCGKTTTLRMIAGLEQPTGGRIALGGEPVTHLPPSRRDVGFVFQFYGLYPHMRVEENVAFPLECSGMGRSERRAAVDRVLARLELEDLRRKLPRELSGGDQQRVALARAMVRRPAVYLMDEPLGTLDADRRLAMCEFLRAQQQELGVTTVYVTHDQEEAMRLADRIVVMEGGRILQAGAPSEVYDEPRSLFVARFVGSPGMNLVPGRVKREGGGLSIELRSEEIPAETSPTEELPSLAPTRPGRTARAPNGRAETGENPPPIRLDSPSADLAPGPIVLGIRPEFLRTRTGGPIRGTVLAGEYLGASRCLFVGTAAGTLVVRTPPETNAPVGEPIELDLDLDHTRLFRPDTGERIA